MNEFENLTQALDEYKRGILVLTALYITDDQIKNTLIPFLSKNSKVTHLCLSDNRIEDKGAIALAANTIITHLDLTGNHIGDEGAIALFANTTLTHLYLHVNQIGVKSIKYLAKSLQSENCSLQYIDLRCNAFELNPETEESIIEALKRNTTTVIEIDKSNNKLLNLLIKRNELIRKYPSDVRFLKSICPFSDFENNNSLSTAHTYITYSHTHSQSSLISFLRDRETGISSIRNVQVNSEKDRDFRQFLEQISEYKENREISSTPTSNNN